MDTRFSESRKKQQGGSVRKANTFNINSIGSLLLTPQQTSSLLLPPFTNNKQFTSHSLLMSVFVFTYIAVAFIAQVTAQDSVYDATETTASTDYFEQVTLFSEGRITRFIQMPIQVHIAPTLKALPYLAEIRYAMRTWETVSDGKIRFQETENLEQSDIRVTATGSSRLGFLDTPLGSAELTRLARRTYTISGDEIHIQSDTAGKPSNTAVDFTVEVTLVVEGDGTTGELTQAAMRTVCLHEFGHAIGLWGHSPDPLDVCHTTATTQYPTARDIETLRKLYNTPLHTPQHDIAINLLKNELQPNTRRARLHYLLGAVYFDKGDMTLAIASFQDCLGIDPNFEPAREKLIQAYDRTGQSHQAIRLVEQRVQNQQGHRGFRESADAYNVLGTLYYRQDDISKAIQAFEDALERAPHHKAAKRNLHQLLAEKAFNALKTNAFDEANTYFQRTIYLDPMNPETYRHIADSYAYVSQFAKAIEYYQKTLEIVPEDQAAQLNLAQSYNNYGVTLRNNGKWDEAIRAYRNALELQPTYQLAMTNLSDVLWQKANAYRQSGRSPDAIATYLELQRLHPDDATIVSLLGELYLRTRDYPAAVSAFHKAYTALPTDKQARHNLIAVYQQYAQALRNQRRYKSAMTQLQKAVDLFPTEINLRLSLSQAYQHVGRYEQARNELEQILAQDPDNTNAKTELVNLQIRRGNTLMNQKRYTEAAAIFEGIPASEKTVDMHNVIGYLYLVQDEHLKALATFEAVLLKHPRNTVAYQNLLSLESQLVVTIDKAKTAVEASTSTDAVTSPVESEPDPTAEKLSRVQCVLAQCLMNRKQPKNAIEKYRQALNVEPYTPELRAVLIDTGKRLANQFQKQNDTQSYETIMRWMTKLDSNFKELLEL